VAAGLSGVGVPDLPSYGYEPTPNPVTARANIAAVLRTLLLAFPFSVKLVSGNRSLFMISIIA